MFVSLLSRALSGRSGGAHHRALPTGAMRLLLVSYEYPPLGGGGAKVVRGLARELVRAGHKVDVITAGWDGLPGESHFDGGVRVTRLRTLRRRADRSSVIELGIWVMRALPTVLRRLASEPYDAINAHFILPDGLVCALACAATGKRFVITAHGSDVPGYNGDRFQLAHRLLGRVWRRLVQAPACIVFPSEHLLALARRQGARFEACVIPNGFDAGLRSRQGERLPRILVATRLFPRKGVQHLIEAHARLDEPVELHVIGDGPYRAALEELARSTGKPVVFHGWVENLSAPFNELMSRASVFAFPSEAENFPVCLLEAMAFELPLVTSSGTGCEAVIGDAGLLVPPGDIDALTEALHRLITSPALRAELARAGRRRLEANFTWAAVARRYAELYAGHPAKPGAAEPASEEAVGRLLLEGAAAGASSSPARQNGRQVAG